MAALAAFLCASALSVVPAVAVAPSTFTVTTTADAPLTGCDDGASGTSLREAVCRAAAARDAIVLVPSGERFALQHGPLVLDPGAAATIVVRATGSTRFEIDGGGTQIFDIDPSLAGHVDVTLSTVTLTHGTGAAPAAGGFGGGAIIAGSGVPGLPDALTLTDCVVTGNRNIPAGSPGGVVAPGGAVLMNGGTLTVRGCTFEGNASDDAPGGAVAMIGVDASDRLVIEGSTFRSNTVTGSTGVGVLGGGAVWVSGARLSVTGSTFVTNSVTSTSASSVLGSAVYATGVTEVTGAVVERNTARTSGADVPGALALGSGTVTASRLVGNTATTSAGPSRAAVRGPLSPGASLAATRSWWGCLGGPADALCDGTAGTVSVTPYATLVGTVSPSAPRLGDATTLTVALTQSDGSAAAPELVALLAGTPVTWASTPPAGAVQPTADAALTADGTAALRYTTGTGPSLTVTTTIDGAGVTTLVENAFAPSVALAASTPATEGTPVVLTATVAARPAATLQWQTAPAGSSTWAAVPGATSATLPLTPSRTDDGARYRLVATNTVAATTGPETTLGVSWGPLVSASPVDVTVRAGSTAGFDVVVAGKPAPSVRWQRQTPGGSWTDIAGATATTYRTAAVGAADSGTRFRAQVTGTAGSVASAEALLTVETVPVVTQQPSPAGPAEGAPLTLEAVFSGSPPVSDVVWEWRAAGTSDWVPVASPASTVTTTTSGATTTSRYEVTAARALTGDYRAVGTAPLVTGTASVTTSTAAVRVQWGPEILTQPADTTVAVGGTATFAVVVAGDPTPTVVWKDAAGTQLGTGLTLTLPAQTLADDGRFVRADVTVGPRTVISRTAVLTVTLAPTVTTGPADVTVDAGSTARFDVVVTGAPTPTVRWQQRSGPSGTWADVTGTGPTLSLVAGSTEDGRQYRAVATSSAGTATSAPATLTVLTPPTVTDPVDVAVTPGSTARFTVAATGSPTPAITWETSTDGLAWNPVTGASGLVLDLVTTIADDGLLVRAVASSTLVGGPATAVSAPATLTVMAAPALVRGPAAGVVGPDGAVRVAAGTPFTLSYVVEAAGASGHWESSRDGGTTWSPFLATRMARAMLAAAATPTAYDLTYTPSAGDAGLMLRLRVTNAAATSYFGPVTVVLSSPTPGTGPAVPGPGTSTGGPASVPPAQTGTGAATTAAGGDRLATTGADVAVLLAAALGVTVCGAVALLAYRRRAA